VKESNGVREICLNHLDTRNSLSMGMMSALHEKLTHNLDNMELRCVVLTAEGNVWSAGHNLKELQASDDALQASVFQKLTDIVLDIRKMPVPVIAKVNGFAAAAGCQLASSCDIIVASDTSNFSTPGAGFGIFCNTPGVAISRVMSRPKSAYMLMTGLPLTAAEAYIAGLITKVVPAEDLDKEVSKITDAIKAKSRAVITLGKTFFYKQLEMSIEEAYEKGRDKMTENLKLEDCHEGISSFIEKRSPVWKHN
ncbi:hypothetical protein KR222_009614, partial [Zaprionus bogoriensis]